MGRKAVKLNTAVIILNHTTRITECKSCFGVLEIRLPPLFFSFSFAQALTSTSSSQPREAYIRSQVIEHVFLRLGFLFI